MDGPLDEWLAATLEPCLGPVRVEDLERVTGGASRETWRFDARAGDIVHELVLRRDPPGRPSLPGGMAREAAAMRACAAAGLAVPDVAAAGDGFVVMRRVPGETLARRILRDDEYGPARAVLATQCGRFLAGLHALDPAAVPGLPHDDPLALLRQTLDAVGQPSPAFELAFRWLDEHRPPPVGDVVVHGDFRLGNLVVGPDGLRAVLDWELLHRGDPAEDLGWLCVKSWRFGAELPVGGFGTREELLAAYRDAGGPEIGLDVLRWWEVLNTLKWGVMCMGQAEAHLSGMLRSVELAAVGRRTCEQEWDLLLLLAPDAVAAWEPPPTGAQPAPDLHGRPTAGELLAAVREFLADDVLPGTSGRLSFHARVAANVVGIVERELARGAEQAERRRRALAPLGVASEAELASAIRAGELDDRSDEVVRVVVDGVADKLAVANPRYLAAVRDRA